MILFFILLFQATSFADVIPLTELSEERLQDLQKIRSPKIEEDILLIEGPIGSHIYDYLAWEAPRLKGIKKIRLNSLGGDLHWALRVAEKIQVMNVETEVFQGHFCASSCVVLFAAGRERKAALTSWFGIHGARPGTSDRIEFQRVCFDSGTQTFNESKADCAEFIKIWRERSLKITDEMFQFMESQGVSAQLREEYYRFPEQTDWYKRANVLKWGDWVLPATQAQKYELVTELF